jgi:hypothetical protein
MPDPAHDRRGNPRQRRRLGCELRVDGKTHTGVVLDLSAQGLFVRTNVQPQAGTPFTVVIRRPGGDVWEIAVRVARKVPRAGSPPSQRGLGLEVVEAPASYHAFVSALGERRRRA